jgi:toxin-antitoxin system PIN domain toxin
MILIDANVLLYAYNPSSKHHSRAKEWLEEVFSKPSPVRLSWLTIMAFLRISTDPRAFPRALSITEALNTVSEWLSLHIVRVLDPGERHFGILTSLLPQAQARGPLVMDGHLAALAIEHGATLCTTDKDFARFPGVRLFNPLEETVD